jgi:hypothetical protein
VPAFTAAAFLARGTDVDVIVGRLRKTRNIDDIDSTMAVAAARTLPRRGIARSRDCRARTDCEPVGGCVGQHRSGSPVVMHARAPGLRTGVLYAVRRLIAVRRDPRAGVARRGFGLHVTNGERSAVALVGVDRMSGRTGHRRRHSPCGVRSDCS